ncbi:protein lines [Teleopsis dalmanni]|uniref:protein lines n=1 Tax=Teleopsis dalmanni TaxID=139649 RepID=UPI0018CF862C|nr:protein lines [Teleopsis dalmanni]XP_037948313.1 protein lines [Teleopsis dalmanni]
MSAPLKPEELAGPSTTAKSSSCRSSGQPQTKRQKIDKHKISNKLISISSLSSTPDNSIPPDIVDTDEIIHTNNNTQLSSSLSSSAHSISVPSSSTNSPTSTPSSSRATSLSQLLNVQNIGKIFSPQPTNNGVCDITKLSNNLSGTTSGCSSGSSSGDQSADEVDRVVLLNMCSSNINSFNKSHKDTNSASATVVTDESKIAQDMREFENSLTKQCLCGVSERTLRKPFQSHYSTDLNGRKRIANISEWPTNKLLQFLSNLQLLFDIYLKQNSKGFICARIMDVCDALIQNDQNLIDEIIILAGYKNAYVQFLASRVLSSFLIIAKQSLDDNWMKKLVNNLFNFDHLDNLAVQKMHFSLEIIKRIVEWKDVDLHPLEDEIAETHENASFSTTSEPEPINSGLETHPFLHLQPQIPSLDTNYFAVHYRANEHDTTNQNSGEASINQCEVTEFNNKSVISNVHMTDILYSSTNNQLENNVLVNSTDLDTNNIVPSTSSNSTHHEDPKFNYSTPLTSRCHIITLTDSESFDTTYLKCITIKILENRWPDLVENLSTIISHHFSIENAENCILNFLQLWENIISVKANLSIEETLPFYAQLDNFIEFLINRDLSCTIYKQMLSLFNEALCYGSTLALQDMLPEKTCKLAHGIMKQTIRMLESMPRQRSQNSISLIGFKRKPVIYTAGTFQSYEDENDYESENSNALEMDKTILQKMVLLVLKSVAVTVKEIRIDSSDSSIDSTDHDFLQDMVHIERAIREVLQKLETFIKHKLEFHPQDDLCKILVYLFDDQDDYLIEAMVCTLDVTTGISFRNNAFPELVKMLNPICTFLEFLKMISNSHVLLLDLLISNETCFLLYLLRFLKYIRINWSMFLETCQNSVTNSGGNSLDESMSVLIRLRLQISHLVARQLYPYDISPVLRYLEICESLYEPDELI